MPRTDDIDVEEQESYRHPNNELQDRDDIEGFDDDADEEAVDLLNMEPHSQQGSKKAVSMASQHPTPKLKGVKDDRRKLMSLNGPHRPRGFLDDPPRTHKVVKTYGNSSKRRPIAAARLETDVVRPKAFYGSSSSPPRQGVKRSSGGSEEAKKEKAIISLLDDDDDDEIPHKIRESQKKSSLKSTQTSRQNDSKTKLTNGTRKHQSSISPPSKSSHFAVASRDGGSREDSSLHAEMLSLSPHSTIQRSTRGDGEPPKKQVKRDPPPIENSSTSRSKKIHGQGRVTTQTWSRSSALPPGHKAQRKAGYPDYTNRAPPLEVQEVHPSEGRVSLVEFHRGARCFVVGNEQRITLLELGRSKSKQDGSVRLNVFLDGDPFDKMGFDLADVKEALIRPHFRKFYVELSNNDLAVPGGIKLSLTTLKSDGADKLLSWLIDSGHRPLEVTKELESKASHHENHLNDWKKKEDKKESLTFSQDLPPPQPPRHSSPPKRSEVDQLKRSGMRRSDGSFSEVKERSKTQQPVSTSSRKRQTNSPPPAQRRSLRSQPAKRQRQHSPDDWEMDDDKDPQEKIERLELPKEWQRPLLYPFEGPKRANVDYQDLERFNAQEFLNDNIINFYLRYLEEQIKEKKEPSSPSLHEETYFFNTYFYERLSMRTANKKSSIDSVLKWTAKIDLFSKSYVVIPINENSHWYLVVICNLQHLERKLSKDSEPERDCGEGESDATLNGDDPSKEISQDPETVPSVSDEAAKAEDEADDKGTVTCNAIRHTTVEVQIPVKSTSEPEKEDKDVAETQEGVESMSLDEDAVDRSHEWPSPDENIQHDRLSENRQLDGKVKNFLQDQRGSADIEQASGGDLDVLAKKGKSAASKPKKKPRKVTYSPDTPAIIVMDSMSHGTQNRASTISRLREWLVREAFEKRRLTVDGKNDIKAIYANIPGQNNWYDCGLYVLHYVQTFFENHTTLCKKLLAKEDMTHDDQLWKTAGIAGMRMRTFKLICDLQAQYQKHEIAKRLVKGKDKVTEAASKPCSKAGSAANSPSPTGKLGVEKSKDNLKTAEALVGHPDDKVQLASESNTEHYAATAEITDSIPSESKSHARSPELVDEDSLVIMNSRPVLNSRQRTATPSRSSSSTHTKSPNQLNGFAEGQSEPESVKRGGASVKRETTPEKSPRPDDQNAANEEVEPVIQVPDTPPREKKQSNLSMSWNDGNLKGESITTSNISTKSSSLSSISGSPEL